MPTRRFDRPTAGNLTTPTQQVRYFDKFLTAIESNFDAAADATAALAAAVAAQADATAALTAALAAAHTADWSGVVDDNSHKPADNATLGATWGTDVASRPTELTDGRVAAGLDSSGDLNRNIASSRATSSNLLRRTGGGLYTGALAATAGATLGTDVSGSIKPSNVSTLVDPLTVGTTYIAANAVTNPTSAYTTGSVSVPDTNTWTDIQTLTISATGQPIQVQSFFFAGHLECNSLANYANAQYRIIRDSTVIFGPVYIAMHHDGPYYGTGGNSASISDQPSSGSRTYKLQALLNDGVGGATLAPTYRSLNVVELKK